MGLLERWDRKNQATADIDNERRGWDETKSGVRIALAGSFVLTTVVAVLLDDLGLIVVASVVLPMSYLMARSLRNSYAEADRSAASKARSSDEPTG